MNDYYLLIGLEDNYCELVYLVSAIVCINYLAFARVGNIEQ